MRGVLRNKFVRMVSSLCRGFLKDQFEILFEGLAEFQSQTSNIFDHFPFSRI